MTPEELAQEQALALAREARTHLCEAYTFVLDLERLHPAVEKLSCVLQGLCLAVERLAQPNQITFTIEDTLDEYGTGQLEQLRESIFGGHGPIREPCETFVISFPDVELDASGIWDDGEGPEHPTPEDVIEAMRECHIEEETPSVLSVIRDWALIDNLYVRAADDEEGEDKVEWDGD